MRRLLLFFLLISGGAISAQENTLFRSSEAVLSGDRSSLKQDEHIVEFTGDLHFSTDIVEIEKAEKIVYDRKTKTFTVSGFSELLLNGKRKPASDLGATTIKVDLGDSIVYLIADVRGCKGGKGKDC